MSLERDIQRANLPEAVSYFVEMVGAGNGVVPTLNFNRNLTATWISTGIIQFTFGDYPGRFVGGGPVGFRATTPSQLKGFSVVFGDPDATGKIVQVNITNSSQTLVDLQTGQRIALEIVVQGAGSGV